MRTIQLSRYLFAVVTACGTNHPTPPPDVAVGCGTYVATSSDVSTCAAQCAAHDCQTGFCTIAPDDNGLAVLSCFQDHTGRRPPGLVRGRSDARCVTGHYFAAMAHLEAASVPAFRQLACELRELEAPRRLVRAANRSAREEVQHARVMARFAGSHHARVPAVVVEPRHLRSVEAVALHNAAEGCVNETYGVAVAMYQSTHARDPELRAAVTAIARDEARHAELAWQIDRWAASRLTAAARARVHRARRRAIHDLATREVVDSTWASEMGLPSAQHHRQMIAALETGLWAEA